MIFKTYTTKIGDTYESISKKLYGLPSSANTIEKINGVVGDLKNGLKLKVPIDNVNDLSGSTLPRVVIEDAEFVIFEELTIVKSLIGVTIAYISVLFDPNDKDHVKYFKFGNNASVYIDNKLKLTGEIKIISPIADKNKRLWTIGIKSHAGLLLDTHIPKTFFPLEYLNVTISEIITRICNGFGVGLVFDDSVEEVLNIVIDNNYGVSASAGITETPFDYILRLVSTRGINVSDDSEGNLFIYKFKKADSVLSIIEGLTTGFTSLGALYDYDSLHRNYHIFSQYGDSDNYAVSRFDIFSLPLHKNIISPDSSSGNTEEYSKWILCRHIGNSIKVMFSLPSFNFEGVSLSVGDIVNIKAQSLGIYEETEMVIEEIKETQTLSEMTKIVLTVPGAYTGEVPERLPLLKEEDV